jgi:hypothetical protein
VVAVVIVIAEIAVVAESVVSADSTRVAMVAVVNVSQESLW